MGIGAKEHPACCRVMVALSASQKLGGGFYERLQHRLEVECRAADDLEHIGSGGLLLEQFAKLVEQAHVLDCDDGLGSKILQQFDLFVGKGRNSCR